MDAITTSWVPILLGPVLTGIVGTLLTIVFRRAFKASDDAVKALHTELKKDISNLQEKIDRQERSVEACELLGHTLEMQSLELRTNLKGYDDIQEKLSSIDSLRAEFLEKFLRASEFNREIQTVTNTLDIVQRKIDHVDARLDSLRSSK